MRTCAMIDLKKKSFLCTKSDKRFKNAYHLRRHNGTQDEEKAICIWCFFSVNSRIMKKKLAAQCQDNHLKHSKLVEKYSFQRENKKRTLQEHAEKHGPSLCKLTESVHE